MALDRRTFLHTVGIGVAATKLAIADDVKLQVIEAPSEKPAVQPPLPDPEGKKLGIAVVGIGHLTMEQIIPGFAQSRHAKLVGLVSGDRKKAETVAAHTGVDPKRIWDYKSFDDIRNDPAVDAVYIVLPNHMHAEYTIRAAAAGKHVLCEKPMATTSADCEKMIAACKAADRKLMIGYRIQYEPHHRVAMRAVRDKKFGTVKMIEGHNGQNQGDPNQWRLKRGGGSLMDVGIYCLNTCRYYLGEEPSWVQGAIYSTPGDPRFKEVDEMAMWQMGFPSGTQASFSSSFGTHRAQRFRALGDKGGWIDLDPAFPYEGIALAFDEVHGKDELRSKVDLGAKQQFTLELDHFASAVRANKQPFTPGEEGLADLKIIEAIFESGRTGKRIELAHAAKLDAYRGTPPEA